MAIVRLASPWVLLLAVAVWAAIVYSVLAPGRRRTGAAARIVLGLLATGLLIAAAAGPALRVSRRGVCPVRIVKDESLSMAPAGREPDRSPLAPWLDALPRGQVEVVRLADQADSDLEAGLRAAAATLPHGQGALLLYTDARETRGDAVRAATLLASRGIAVHAIAPEVQVRDVGIVSVRPDVAPAGTVRLNVRLASTLTGTVTVRLRRRPAGQTPPAQWDRTANVEPGDGPVLVFEEQGLPDGLYRYEVALTDADDDFAENDSAACVVHLGRPTHVAYIRGSPDRDPPAPALRQWLPPEARLSVHDVADGPIPEGASVVILDNVSAWALGEQAARRLSREVTDGGTGLLVLGGDAAFAAGGYADSPLEALLPVSSRTGARPPVEMVLVVDASGSMNELVGTVRKLALAKQAVLALRPALGTADRLGLVAFAGEPRVVSAPVPLGEWDALRSRLLALAAGGGTRITPAVEMAASLFTPADRDPRTVRHLLLLSDGRSEDFRLERLVTVCEAAGASVSVVATGPDADRDRLGRLAAQTGGRLYASGDLGRLAETFLKDLAWARGEALRPLVRTTTWDQPGPIWPAAGAPLPPVPACNVTRPKEGADVHWVTGPRGAEADASPLLASWRRGLGKVVAAPWPLGTASGKWLTDETAAAHLAPILRWLSASPVPTDWSARLERRDGTWWACVEQRGDSVGPSSPFVATALTDDAGPSHAVTLEQVAPGIHEASLAGWGSAASAIVVRRADGGGARARLSVPALPPLEFSRLGVDRARLQAIVEAGAGRVHESPASFAEAVRRTELRGYRPVGIYLVWAAALVVAAQAVLRILGKL